ncbi:DNA polymerase Y family protein [Subtercola boreus]|uniref:DNA polymerase n=1 Tax=Subtercola boreus TaxID=120213 RepID=A0A3E0WD87_9MICO|nr:DNA polymerase Y family protein [Subtercola boreus]RFA21271.1 DNA polymerase [Subtercola boreus]RFA21654.1 DNA polymerase [Subtercola boreus]RFA27624.1 DNA polymerase [Subtercola boreus]
MTLIENTAVRHSQATRTMVLWCPDWPVRALAQFEGIPVEERIALVEHGVVFACSASARAEGVRRGQRIREAQAACVDLMAFDYDPALDYRSFEPVALAVEELMPGVQLLRPGMCALAARGPARYYGGERAAAGVLLTALVGLGVEDARITVADGRFAAEQLARMPGETGIRIVEAGGSPQFLADHPIEAVGDSNLSMLLRRLGLTTLGSFAALDFRDVRARFGETGVYAHTLASGRDVRRVVPRLPPQLRDIEVAFEPPLDRVDQITFAFRTAAERFVDELTSALLVCTSIRVELHTDNGLVHDRGWGHPRWFSANDVLDRIRWQVQGRTGAGAGALTSAISRVRVLPEGLDSIGNYETGLWGSTPDDRIHHGLSRVQSLLGHGAVMTAVIAGGRGVVERQVMIPWGDPRGGAGDEHPWPGSIPLPAPSTVFEKPRAVTVQGHDGGPVDVTDRGSLTCVPALFAVSDAGAGVGRVAGAGGMGGGAAHGGGAGGGLAAVERQQPIAAWAGPWPVYERWWDQAVARSFHRFQVVDASGTAWLLALHEHGWWAEARYD